MALKIYNTLTREKEDFRTLEPGKVRMYVCGPTVYDRAHIGHAMSALVFDVVRRYLEYSGCLRPFHGRFPADFSPDAHGLRSPASGLFRLYVQKNQIKPQHIAFTTD